MEIAIHCKYDELLPIKEINPDPANRNKHDKDQIENLAEIIEYQGWRHPLIINQETGLLRAGHGRLLAAKKLKLKEVPVVYQSFKDSDQDYAFMVSDNAIARQAELDLSGINADIGNLGPDFDIKLLGIKDFKIDIFDEPEGDPDEVPEVKEESKVVQGEVYILGNHRLMCGDSTSITDVEKLMNGEKCEICFTSPPYNAGRDPMKSERCKKTKQNDKYNLYDDKKDQTEWLELASQALLNSMIICQYQFFNVQHLAGNKIAFIDFLNNFKNNLVDICIWDKEHAVPQMAENVMSSQFEYVLIFSAKENPAKSIECAQFKRGFSNVYKGKRQTKNEYSHIHAATFPTHFSDHFVANFTNPRSGVLDLFSGTGTTLVSCEKLNRNSYNMELDPKYCQVILDRWQKYTGKKAIREDGKLWDDIKEGK